jgi:hypothetical protein
MDAAGLDIVDFVDVGIEVSTGGGRRDVQEQRHGVHLTQGVALWRYSQTKCL